MTHEFGVSMVWFLSRGKKEKHNAASSITKSKRSVLQPKSVLQGESLATSCTFLEMVGKEAENEG
jgi:hypothetical protein